MMSHVIERINYPLSLFVFILFYALWAYAVVFLFYIPLLILPKWAFIYKVYLVKLVLPSCIYIIFYILILWMYSILINKNVKKVYFICFVMKNKDENI